jgi:tetratricopeptide (TPR) repeat protein
VGRKDRAVHTLDTALARSPLGALATESEFYFQTAIVYAMAGRPDRARQVLTEYRSDIRDTARRREEEPWTHSPLAEIALAEGRPLEAVREFRQAEMASDGTVNECAVCTHALVGRAFDAAGIPDSAIAFLELYLRSPAGNRLQSSWIAPSVDAANLAYAYRRLGELYDARGDRATAVRYYEQFVALWRDADAELQPRVAKVRARLRSLGSPSP